MHQRTPWIAHVDMDCFYVAVERLLNPSLNGKAVAVGGISSRSVISSASYEARKFGVKSAMSSWQARKLCPRLILVPPNFSAYSEYSRKIFSELKVVAPVVEQVSIDEAYLDFTGCEGLYSSREQSARAVKESIFKSSGLISTVGIATNKLVAKIASDSAKPDGLLVIPPGSELAYLRPMSLGKIPGVGKKSLPLYEAVGLKSCGDLLDKSDAWLLERFGRDVLNLKLRAAGIDSRTVSDEREEAKSIGGEETFDTNISDRKELEDTLRILAEDIARELRQEGLKARTIQLKYRFPDFSTYTRALTLDEPTYLSRLIAETSIALLTKNLPQGLALRLIGLSCRNFSEATASTTQLDLFCAPNTHEREEKIEHLKDTLRARFGKNAVVKPR